MDCSAKRRIIHVIIANEFLCGTRETIVLRMYRTRVYVVICDDFKRVWHNIVTIRIGICFIILYTGTSTMGLSHYVFNASRGKRTLYKMR